MSVASCWIRIEAEFADKHHTRVKKLKVAEMRKTPPDPATSGLWVKVNVDIPDQVFVHLVPEINAEIQSQELEALVADTELYHMITGRES